jgi:L-amino acid N-acyltransferase YncA
MHGVATQSFRDSYLYTPLGREEFAALYYAVLPVIEPRLISMAEHEGRVVGFCFCVPNASERTRHGRIESAILKTFAVLPGYAGLGGVLAARTNAAARELGFSRVIHALMHEDNARSRALSARSAREIRGYALFERRLRS